MGVATGCGCKKVYRFPHSTYPYSSCICSFLQQHPNFLFIFKNVFRSCKKIKDCSNEMGRNKKNWKFYGPLNEILGNRPATRPIVVIDSLHETNDVEESCERQSEGGSVEKGTSEDQGGNEQGAEKCDAEKEQGEKKEDGRSQKQPTNEKGALEKIILRELYKWLSRT